jgi:hypothetical protein
MPSTPTATDEKLEGRIDGLTATLADFRLETEKRFGSVEKVLSGILEQLRFIRWIGVFFAGILVILVGASIGVTWNASALNSEVKHQGQRLEKVEARLDAIDRKLDTLISRTAPAPKPGG